MDTNKNCARFLPLFFGVTSILYSIIQKDLRTIVSNLYGNPILGFLEVFIIAFGIGVIFVSFVLYIQELDYPTYSNWFYVLFVIHILFSLIALVFAADWVFPILFSILSA